MEMNKENDMEKKHSKIWQHRDDIKGGKFLVLRRDNTVFPGPHFVLGPRDPAAARAMREYAIEARRLGYHPEFVASCFDHADMMAVYRAEHGDGDPDRGPHRKDDPAVVDRMLEGA